MPDCSKCGEEQNPMNSYTISKPFLSDIQLNPKKPSYVSGSSCLCDKCFQENKENILVEGR